MGCISERHLSLRSCDRRGFIFAVFDHLAIAFETAFASALGGLKGSPSAYAQDAFVSTSRILWKFGLIVIVNSLNLKNGDRFDWFHRDRGNNKTPLPGHLSEPWFSATHPDPK